MRDQNQQRFLNVLSGQENARRGRMQQYNQNLNSILDPLQSAANAFAMADVFAGDKPEKSKSLGNWGDGSNKLLNPAGFGGGTSADLIRRG